MTTVEDLRGLLAEFARTSTEQSAATNDALQRLALAMTLNAATGPAGGAGLAVGLTALQTVRKSSESTVQLSLSDQQYTLSESSPVGAVTPTGLTRIDALPETTPDETAFKSDELLDFHRSRGAKLRDAQRTLPEMGHG